MEKLRSQGGLKLINIKLKSQTPKVYWLLNLMTDENLIFQKNLFNLLVGTQKGQLKGEDIIFAEQDYVKHLNISNNFYRDALEGITKLHT